MQITKFLTFGLLLLSTVYADLFVDEEYDGAQQRLPPIMVLKMVMGLGPKIDRHVKRIIGGKDINIGNFKHQVSLRKNGVHICGASIIGSNWVLTAGHCLEQPLSPKIISFRAGSSARASGGVIYNAAQMFIHPDYNSVTFDFDVAVIRTVEQMGGRSIAPIKIVNANGIVPANSLMTVTGWGRTEAGTLPINLKGVIVPVVNNEVCLKQWGGEITFNMMCAGLAGRDACNGDSGGPVSAGDILFGIVSWGSTTCGSALPGVYTNITNPDIRNFISRTAGI